MDIIEFSPVERDQLNGVLGDIIGSILNPSGNTNQSAQLENELFYKEQELLKTRQQKKWALGAAVLFGAATGYLGYKNFKNAK